MKNASSQELYAYWEKQRGMRSAPARTDIEPGAIRHILSDSFILALDGDAGHPFRLAGTRLCALFGRELKGESFLDLWNEENQRVVADLIGILNEESVGTVAGVTAQNAAGDSLDLELLLLPLDAPRPLLARTIGILAPLKPVAWLGTSPLGPLCLGPRRHVGASLEKRLLPRFMSATRRRLTVHQGGRVADAPSVAP